MAEEELPTVEYTSPIARDMATLASIEGDLMWVGGCCERLLEDSELEVRPGQKMKDDPAYIRALWSSILVGYRRSIFDAHRGWVREKIIDPVLDQLDPSARTAHQWIKDMCDKSVAHDVNPHFEFKVCLMLPPEGKDEEGPQGCGTVGIQHLRQHDDSIQGIKRLTEILLDVIRRNIEIHRKIVLEEARQIPMDELRKRPELKFSAPTAKGASKTRPR